MNQSIWADPPPTVESKPERHVAAEIPVQPKSTNDESPAHPPEPSSSTATFLSGAASSFDPDLSAPPPDGSSADMFAQTGAIESDLFDDVVPVEEHMRIRSDDDLFSDDFTPAPQPVVEQLKPQPVREPVPVDSSRGGRGRGNNRGRGRGPREGRNDTRGSDPQNGRRPATEESSATSQSLTSQNTQSEDAAVPTAPRAVRGDRHATGGVKKPKLTEEELAEKMAKIQIKNASLMAAHARAEADATSFAEREQHAKQVTEQRRKEERRDRQQMMGEREKNRMRKLKAMEGREWDMEKNEDDFGKGGRFDKRGGFAGDQQDYADGREYLYREPRGGKARGGGVAGSRGGRDGRLQDAPKKEDFPALPSSGKTVTAATSDLSTPGKSWADQVEAT